MASQTSLLLLLLLLANLHLISCLSYTTLVYKGCARQSLTDPTGVYSQAISSLFGTLVSQSSRQKFFKTSITGTSQTTITGLFQCRGDLTNVDCYNCVSKLPILIDKLCGQTIAARVQLSGCYMLHQVDAGFTQVSGLQMVYKTCGKNSVGNGFVEKKGNAFEGLVNGIVNSGNGFYAGVYEGVYVLGQCEGSLGISDCGQCVKSAVKRSEMECGGSSSGQVFLDKCFVGYSYYPNGVPTKSSSKSNAFSSPSGPEQNPGKTVAIILGGALVIGFVVICLMFIRRSMKKHDDDDDY